MGTPIWTKLELRCFLGDTNTSRDKVFADNESSEDDVSVLDRHQIERRRIGLAQVARVADVIRAKAGPMKCAKVRLIVNAFQDNQGGAIRSGRRSHHRVR